MENTKNTANEKEEIGRMKAAIRHVDSINSTCYDLVSSTLYIRGKTLSGVIGDSYTPMEERKERAFKWMESNYPTVSAILAAMEFMLEESLNDLEVL